MSFIASLGDIDVDLLVRVDQHPRPGEEAFARDSEIGSGGSAANTAVVLARLGFDVRLLAQVGDDEFGRRAVRNLEGIGVDTTQVAATGDDTTGMNVVTVDPGGERTMIGLRGANRTFGLVAGWEDGCEWLHISGYALLEQPQRSAGLEALALSRDRGIPFSVDVPSGVATVLGPALREALEGAAVVAAGRRSITSVSADPSTSLAPRVGMLAITDGVRPFTLYRDGEEVTIRPPALEAVDTTGAGDSFAAGLIAAHRWGLDTGSAAVVAAVLGAAATRRRGAGGSLADPAAVGEALSPRWWGHDVDPRWLAEAARVLSR